MNFGLDINKLLLIGVVVAIFVGPERLPKYAATVTALLRRGGKMLRDAKTRVADEVGPEFTQTDWRKLDPRQYDPRQIIRDALLEDFDDDDSGDAGNKEQEPGSARVGRVQSAPLNAGELPPYDPEST